MATIKTRFYAVSTRAWHSVLDREQDHAVVGQYPTEAAAEEAAQQLNDNLVTIELGRADFEILRDAARFLRTSSDRRAIKFKLADELIQLAKDSEAALDETLGR
jgi:hypothetical protein